MKIQVLVGIGHIFDLLWIDPIANIGTDIIDIITTKNVNIDWTMQTFIIMDVTNIIIILPIVIVKSIGTVTVNSHDQIIKTLNNTPSFIVRIILVAPTDVAPSIFSSINIASSFMSLNPVPCSLTLTPHLSATSVQLMRIF